MRRKSANILDIARLAGVSTATVSRTLSNPAVVAETTRLNVMRAVHDTGYRVNRTARNLRRQRTGSILALVPNLANPFFSEILSGLASVMTPLGYGLLVADTRTDPDANARLAGYLRDGVADGIVVFDGALSPGAFLQGAHPPVVMACEWIEAPLPSVTVDNAAGAALAIRHLAEMGHRAIGHVTGPPGNVLTRSRLEGVEAALDRLGLPRRADWIFPGDFSLASGAAAAARWRALPDRPTAVFCASDEMACGFVGALQHAGVAVPGEVSVVGFDGIEIGAHLTPALTTVRQPRRGIGERAARTLVGMIDAEVLTAPSQVIPVELIRRASVARR